MAFSQSGLSCFITCTLPSIRTVSLSVVRTQGWLDGLCVCSIPTYVFRLRVRADSKRCAECVNNYPPLYPMPLFIGWGSSDTSTCESIFVHWGSSYCSMDIVILPLPCRGQRVRTHWQTGKSLSTGERSSSCPTLTPPAGSSSLRTSGGVSREYFRGWKVGGNASPT